MAVVTVDHHPELTVVRARQLFDQHLGDKYHVYHIVERYPRNRDFAIERSNWAAVGVKLKQEENRTAFVFTAFLPSSPWTFLLAFAGLIPYFLVRYAFLKPSWRAMEEEVKSFIENAPEFH